VTSLNRQRLSFRGKEKKKKRKGLRKKIQRTPDEKWSREGSLKVAPGEEEIVWVKKW